MTTELEKAREDRRPELLGQTVVDIGGSSGIGLETARRARAGGAEVILAAQTPRSSRMPPSRWVPSPPRHSTPTTTRLSMRSSPVSPARSTTSWSPPAGRTTACSPTWTSTRCAAGFVDTPLSAELLGDHLEARRDELRATLPIRRVVGPEDVAALAVHLMSNTALTGATYDIDGGQQLLAR